MPSPSLPALLFFTLLTSSLSWSPSSPSLLRSRLSHSSPLSPPHRVNLADSLLSLKLSETEQGQEPTLDEIEGLNFKGKGAKRGKSKKGEVKDEKPAR